MSTPISHPREPVRVWFVTGTSTGFGRAIAEAVIDRGECLVATARDISAIADLAAEAPERCRIAHLDLTDPASIATAVAEAEHIFGRVDVLVNNAGYGLLGAFEELSDEQVRHAYETNLFGAMALVRTVLPGMRMRRSGHIVQMSSMIGVTSGLGGSGYAGPKAALEAMSEALAAEVRHLGIQVTIVEPGPFRTDGSGRSVRWGTELEDYADVIAPARLALEASHGRQPGDPERGATAIMAAIDLDPSPLRLPLGPEAFQAIRDYLRSRIQALEPIEALGTDTAFHPSGPRSGGRGGEPEPSPGPASRVRTI